MQTKVIEIPAPVTSIDHSLDHSIATLAIHPGFLELMKRFQFQKYTLESQLRRDLTLDQVTNNSLKQGIFWIEYLTEEVNRRVHKTHAPKPLQVRNELEEFEKIHSALQRINPA